MSDKIHVTEMFLSFQGEGLYTGKNTAWVRLFNCNLSCDGFGQIDPTNKETYKLPYKDFDVSKINMVEELPVFEYGCDSSYSWSKKFKHLIPEYSPQEIANKLYDIVGDNFVTQNGNHITNTHLCFTGGEPLLKRNQKNIISILNELDKRDNLPSHITFETNGSVELTDEFIDVIDYYRCEHDIEFLASCSPKLFSVSGEPNKRAWNHYAIKQYCELFDLVTYKFVVNGSNDSWNEVSDYISKLPYKTNNIYIMPVGATVEQQSDKQVINIVNTALSKGYNVSGRLHCYIFGNTIGT